MSRHIKCDFCGRYEWGESSLAEWMHHYGTGKDECASCLANRREREDAERWDKIRASVGLPPKGTLSDAEGGGEK